MSFYVRHGGRHYLVLKGSHVLVITLIKVIWGSIGNGMICMLTTSSLNTKQRVEWFRELKP
jgi:hypothetical protein